MRLVHLLEILSALFVTAELGWSIARNIRFSLRQTELRTFSFGMDALFTALYLVALFVLWRALL